MSEVVGTVSTRCTHLCHHRLTQQPQPHLARCSSHAGAKLDGGSKACSRNQQPQQPAKQRRPCSCSPPPPAAAASGLLVRFDPKCGSAICSLAGHGEVGFRGLRAMRRAGRLCDLTLRPSEANTESLDDGIICHRLVLACWSPLFRASANASPVFVVPAEAEASGSVLASLVDFCYTGCLQVTSDTALPLLAAACALQLEPAARCCDLFIANHRLARPVDVVAARAAAERWNRRDLLECVDARLIAGFRELTATPDFADLSTEAMESALRSERLDVVDEVQAFAGLMQWVRARPGEREQLVDRLLPHIRLTQLPADYLTETVSRDPLLQGRRDCTDLVLQACAFQLDGARICSTWQPQLLKKSLQQQQQQQQQQILTPSSPTLLSTSALTSAQRRPRMSYAGSVFCVGGRGPAAEPYRSVEVFDLLDDAWFPVQPMRTSRRHCGLAVTDGLVYAVGGHDGDTHLATAEAYLPEQNTWRRVARMSTPRRGLALASLGGCLFAVGGLDDAACFDTVERYDPASDRWSLVASTRTPRGGSAGASVDSDSRLLVCGGNDSSAALTTCELYDPVKNMWLPAAPMRQPRAGAAAAADDVSRGICVLGGFDDRGAVASVERYDPRCDRWFDLPPMTVARGGLGAVALWGRLYAVGGHDGAGYLGSTERLDAAAGVWEMAPGLALRRAGAGVCLLTGCPVDRLRANRID